MITGSALRQRQRRMESGPDSRGNRFAAQMGQRAPIVDFDHLMQMPFWQLHTPEHQAEIAATTALMHFRGHIDRALDGQVLGGLASMVGEDRFDRICAAPMPRPEQLAPYQAALPRPSALLAVGRDLLDRAGTEQPIAALCRQASQIVAAPSADDDADDVSRGASA